jgi:hypothetical protein
MDIAFNTSLLVVLLDPRDLWHNQAIALETALQSSGFQAVYFDCVLAETVSVATRRLCEKKRFPEIDALLDRIVANFPPETITWIGAGMPALSGGAARSADPVPIGLPGKPISTCRRQKTARHSARREGPGPVFMISGSSQSQRSDLRAGCQVLSAGILAQGTLGGTPPVTWPSRARASRKRPHGLLELRLTCQTRSVVLSFPQTLRSQLPTSSQR